jgi:hypothetical protein
VVNLCSNCVRTRAALGSLGDASGIGGDALESGPALGEQGEPVFTWQRRSRSSAFLVRTSMSSWQCRMAFRRGWDADTWFFCAAVGEAEEKASGANVWNA